MNVKPVKVEAEISLFPVAHVHSLPSPLIDGFTVSTTLDILQQISRRKAALAHAVKNAERSLGQYGLSLDQVEEEHGSLKQLSEEDKSSIETWKRRKEELKEAFARLNVIYRFEQERVDRKIVGTLELEPLKRKLALWHPDLFEKIGKGVPKNADSLRTFAEEALPHVLSSTISNTRSTANMRFTFKQEGDRVGTVKSETEILISGQVIQCWMNGMAGSSNLNSGFAFRASDGLLDNDGKPSVLMAGRGIEFIVPLRFIPDGHLKKGVARRKKEWVRSLGIAGEDGGFEQLVRTGVLLPVLPEQFASKRPLLGLSLVLKGNDHRHARRLHRLFHLLDATLQMMSETSSKGIVKQRDRAVRTANKISQLLGVPSASDNGSDLLKEETVISGPPVQLPEKIKKDLEGYTSELSLAVIRSAITKSLSTFFVEKFGEDSECRNILEFLVEYAGRPDKVNESIRIAHINAERARKKERDVLSLNPSEQLPNGTIKFRIAASSAQSLERGDYKVLITDVGVGQGLASLEDNWRNTVCPEAEPLIFSYGDDWRTEQGRSGRRLIWPTSRQRNGRLAKQLTLADLVLKHDEKTDSLQILSPEGHPVSVEYSGETPASQLPELVRVFLSISNPWVGIPKMASGKLLAGHSPRVTKGNVVMTAAEWRIPVRDVPVVKEDENDFYYFVRLHDWLVSSGIPKEVMYRTSDPCFPVESEKDRYIHFGIPHLIRRFCNEIKEANGKMLVLTEVFPERGAHMVGRSGHPCVTEFQVPVVWH